jgi:hypothetical protein
MSTSRLIAAFEVLKVLIRGQDTHRVFFHVLHDNAAAAVDSQPRKCFWW